MKRILIRNIKGLVQAGENIPRIIKGHEMRFIPVIENAFLALDNGMIVAYGTMEELDGIDDWRNLELIDGEGRYVLPAFCDAHTHTIFAHSREDEFVARIHGLTYEEIAKKGGGILNSAKRLNGCTEDVLFEAAFERIMKMISYGTGALEIKSGYGLNFEGELKMLRVIKRLKDVLPIKLKATFLGAHAFPTEYKRNPDGYISLICDKMLPAIAAEGLADFIDCFCEKGFFSVNQMEEILVTGKKYGLIPKVHVNQFSVMGGVKKAIECGALSVDHLEECDDMDIFALKDTTCMPTLLPGCSHFLNIPYANARKMISHGLPIALASDFNPGTSPCSNLQQVWSLACLHLKMTPEEALNALTVNAAYAMGLSDSHGKIALGRKTPILITHRIPSLSYIPYAFGDQHIERVIW
jgi:imidazolonepropionase